MADPYYGYSSTADAGSVARSGFPGYFPSEAPSLASYPTLNRSLVQGIPSDYSQKDINPIQAGPYGYGNIASAVVVSDPVISSSNPEPYRYKDSSSIVAHPEAVISGVTTGAASIKRYTPPIEDPNLVTKRWDANSAGMSPNFVNERPSSVRNVGGTPVGRAGESNLLFVDGLPRDCTRREVGHLFRPFIGFKDIRVVHKEPRRSGDMALVLCFVEFTDSKCALTAMEALQGYKFDDKKPESPTLRIQFAHFPFRLPFNSTD